MPIPLLPEAFTAVLELDRTAALAAAFLIGNHHADILLFAARVVGGNESAELRQRATRPLTHKSGHKPRNSGGDARLAKRVTDDQALVKAMRSNPDGSIRDWSQTIHKSRTSTVSVLHRLRDAGLAESTTGRWRLVEEPRREPSAKWIQPLSAAREHRAHASA